MKSLCYLSYRTHLTGVSESECKVCLQFAGGKPPVLQYITQQPWWGGNHKVLLFIYLSCPWPELHHWSCYKYMIWNRSLEISLFSLFLKENIAAFILSAAAVAAVLQCKVTWCGMEEWFNLDKMLEWNISNQQVTEIKMFVTFFQWGSNPCWQQYHIVCQLVRIVQNCIFWHGKMCFWL